jgi:hypothetical protein
MTKCSSAPPMPPLTNQDQKESAEEETNQKQVTVV